MRLITRRRMLATSAGAAALAAVAPAAESAQRRLTMEITRSGSQPSQKGPADYFTGAVRIDLRFQGRAPARIGGATVTFEPGARAPPGTPIRWARR
jgi:hypothetical protein